MSDRELEATATAAAHDGAPATGWRRLRASHARTVAVGAIGAAAGGAYAYFVGCHTGTCLITSSVWTASLYGFAVGAVLGWPVRR